MNDSFIFSSDILHQDEWISPENKVGADLTVILSSRFRLSLVSLVG